MNQQRPNVAVAALADSAEDLAVAARTLFGNKPEPGCKMTARAKALWIIHYEDESGRGHDAHSRYRHQSPASIRLFRPGFKSTFSLPNSYLGFAYLLKKQDQHGASGIWQLVLGGIADQIGQFPDVACAPSCDEANSAR